MCISAEEVPHTSRHLPITPEECFATLIEEFLDKPEVTPPIVGERVRRVGTENSAENLCSARRRQTCGQTSPRLEVLVAVQAAHRGVPFVHLQVVVALSATIQADVGFPVQDLVPAQIG